MASARHYPVRTFPEEGGPAPHVTTPVRGGLRQTARVHARSALFDLWGDHVRHRGGRAPVAAVVRLLAALGINEPAVRTAVSRMVRQGWLEPVRTPGGPGYALTDRARDRLDDSARRIYRVPDAHAWDGHWHVVVLPSLPSRSSRDRVRAALGFLGYAPLQGDTWIAPRRSSDLTASLAAEDVAVHGFDAVPDEEETGIGGTDPVTLARSVWDLDALAQAYEKWHDEALGWVADAGPDAGDEQQFAARSQLVHEWRKFLFQDPGLPGELLPPDWPGHRAAALFDRESARLAPAAARFVDLCLRPNGDHE